MDCGQVVDSGASSRYVPIHHCRRSGTATDPCSAANDFQSLGDCQGSCSNFDDDWVSNISPGSTIMYIVYGTAAGYCPTEGEHAAIFDAAVDCIFAEAAGNYHNSSPIQLIPIQLVR